ncbi:hypothetical protein [Fibrella aquatica]|jgi:hypothetical protein|uniref:hypothetical protein n=1 Tax=Fibrella aquatica TaxID=3242487 RepID=UPI003520990C
MRVALFLTTVTTTACLSLFAITCFGQYGGGQYGGQYGGGGGMGMGRQMSGMNAGNNFKPSMPNIAGELAGKETKWLKEKVNLTKDQLKAVKTLNNEYAKVQQEALKEILGSDGGKSNPQAGQQMRDAMMMYNEEKEDKLKVILTPEQWVSYQTQKPEMQRVVGGIRPPAPKGIIKDSTSTTTADSTRQ